MNRSEALKGICKLVLDYMPTSNIKEVVSEVDSLLKKIEHPKMVEAVEDLWKKWNP